jgi:hypothetical protein
MESENQKNPNWQKYEEEALNRLKMLEATMKIALQKVRREINYVLEKKEPNMRATEFSSLRYAINQVMEFPEFKDFKPSKENVQP